MLLTTHAPQQHEYHEIKKILCKIPDRYMNYFLHYLYIFNNDTTEFHRPFLRPSFERTLPIVVVIFGLLAGAGTLVNSWMIHKIWKENKQRRDDMCVYLLFNSLNDLFKLLIVLPTSLFTLFVHNWIMGATMCYVSPILQDFPFYLTLLTFLLCALDRYRFTMKATPLRVNPIWNFMGAVGVASLFILPYISYTHYFYMEDYFGEQFAGTGLCACNLSNNIQEFIRALFILLYAMPVALVFYLHSKERDRQNMLVSMVIVYTLCLLPLNVTRLITHIVTEEPYASPAFDKAFGISAFLAFCPCITTPALFRYWYARSHRLVSYVSSHYRHLSADVTQQQSGDTTA